MSSIKTLRDERVINNQCTKKSIDNTYNKIMNHTVCTVNNPGNCINNKSETFNPNSLRKKIRLRSNTIFAYQVYIIYNIIG